MKFLKDNWLIIVIIFLFGGNLLQFLNPIVKIKTITEKDTVTVVKIDSVSLTRAKAELNYLREELKNAKGKIVYRTKVDTVQVTDQATDQVIDYVVPNFIASLDTTINQSKLSLSYHYPQNYFSDIRFTFPKVTTKVTETIQEKPLFDFSHGILVGGFVSQDGVIRLGIGYGFKIGLNF